MRVLFDQNVPRRLGDHLPKHQVTRTAQLGWGQLRNGHLLQVSEEHGFECLVTADRNLSYQQNLADRKIAIVVLPPGNWPIMQTKLVEIVTAIDEAKPGSFRELNMALPRRKPR